MLVLEPSLYRPFSKRCTLSNKAWRLYNGRLQTSLSLISKNEIKCYFQYQPINFSGFLYKMFTVGNYIKIMVRHRGALLKENLRIFIRVIIIFRVYKSVFSEMYVCVMI